MKKMLSLVLLLVVMIPTLVFAQTKLIKGKVTDDAGKGIEGVTVTLKDSDTKAITDAVGNFTIAVPATLQKVDLVFTHVNFVKHTEPVKGTDVSVSLTKTQSNLDDVVVIGYGTAKKRNVTGAVANFNAEKVEERPVQRVDQALIGQLAGVQVKQTTGGVGKPFSVVIRGSGTMNGSSEPLYVIDGFPVSSEGTNTAGNFENGSPLDNLNPNDIESIQVLKDAAAAAIYGSRAANGVVLITTKRGKIGKNQINFNTYTGITKAGKKIDLLDGQQWIDRSKVFIDASYLAIAGTAVTDDYETRRTKINTFNNNNAILPGQFDYNRMYDPRWDMPGHPGLDFVDWQDAVFRTGNFQNYQLSASGGTENVRYFVSGNHQNNSGYVTNMYFKTYSIRANIEVNLTKKMKFGINVAPSYSIRQDPGVEGKDNTLHKVITQAPIQESSSLNDEGRYISRYAWGGSAADESGRFDRIGQSNMMRTLASSYFDLEIVKGLVARSTFNFDNADNTSKSYVPASTLGSISGSLGAYRKQNFVNENTLSYNKTLKNVHNISAIAGYSYNTYKINKSSVGSTATSYTNYSNTTITNGTGSTSEEKAVMISYFGRLQYDYDGKYLLSASLRRDGSSRFGANNRWALFPSASLGWRISSEKFFKVSQINDLKLRASYGVGGSNSIGNYAALSTLSPFNYSFNNTTATGQGIGSIPNPNLKWEKSFTFNYGLDAAAFKNRITLSFDYYVKTNKDLLTKLPALGSSGYSTFLTNIGTVKNKGWELELSTRNISGKQLQWTTSLNFTHNNNKVVELDGQQTKVELTPLSGVALPFSIMEVGQSMYSIYVVKQNGVLTADDIAKGVPLYGNQKAGDAKYVDASGDGKITAEDRRIQGKPNASYTWGITNTLKYKGFDLTVMVQGQNGGSIYSLFGRAVNLTGMSRTQNALDVDVNTRGRYNSSFGHIVNTDWLYSSNYVSVRTINIGYDLTKVIKNKYFKGARIYVSGENWFYWDKYKGGYNPESTNINISGDSNFPQPGDYGGLPLAKSAVLGLNLTF